MPAETALFANRKAHISYQMPARYGGGRATLGQGLDREVRTRIMSRISDTNSASGIPDRQVNHR